MRRHALLRFTTLAVAAAAALAVLGGAGASRGAPLAITLELDPITAKDCPAPKVVIGAACVQKEGIHFPDKWTSEDRSAHYEPEGHTVEYAWTVPDSIPPAGAAMTMKLQLNSKLGNFCPGIGVGGGVGFKTGKDLLPQPVQISACVPPGKPGSASASKAMKVVPPDSAPGPVYMVVGIGSGPHYTYRYKATPKPGCRRTNGVGRSAGCLVTVDFVFTQGGRPRGAAKDLLDMTTNGIGSITLEESDDEDEPPVVKKVTARVLRTAEFVNPNSVPPTSEVGLVFRGGGGDPAFYDIGKRGTTLAVPLELVSSNDPGCPRTRSRSARVSVFEGRGTAPDAVTLKLSGCREHTSTFADGGIGSDGKRRKPLVQVVISERTGRPT